MKKLASYVGVVAAAGCAALFLYACSSKEEGFFWQNGTDAQVSYTGNTGAADLSTTAAILGIFNNSNNLVPACAVGTTAAASAIAVDQALPQGFLTSAAAAIVSAAVTQPADIPGTCAGSPGKITFPNWSHSNGTTTGTLSYVNYCTTTPAGNRVILSGDMPYVINGTPGTSGPITTSVVANAPLVTIEKRSADGGTVLEQSSFAFTNFLYTPASPDASGPHPTASNPNTYSLSSFVITNKTTGKQGKIENVLVKENWPVTGGNICTVAGSLCDGAAGCTSVSTDPNFPLVMNSLRKLVSGKLVFAGANGKTAGMTAIPGSSQSFTLDSTTSQMDCSAFTSLLIANGLK